MEEIKLWALSLFTDLIGRVGVTDKWEGSKEVCWVSEIITVSRFTKLHLSSSSSSIWSLAVMSESNSFKLLVDHVLSQISDLDRSTNIFSIVALFLLTVLMYDMLAIILSALVITYRKYPNLVGTQVHIISNPNYLMRILFER